MRLLFVVQRYGAGVAGGAEAHCRAFATRLAARGHEVEVLTSCALSYTTWANELGAGDTVDEGVVVHRLPTARPRDADAFGPLSTRVLLGRYHAPLHLQRRWLEAQGPDLVGLAAWLLEQGHRFDVVVFFTYLYLPTIAGLEVVAGRRPTVLHPTAHDEPAFHLPVVGFTLHLPDAFAFSTPEERELVATKTAVAPPSAVIGVGVDMDPSDLLADAGGARRAVGIGDRPYVLAVGRVDASKGSHELAAFFCAYKQRHPGPLALVLAGDPVQPVPDHPDVIQAGVVAVPVKHGLYAGAELVVVPSFFESFSMVLTEAWTHGRAALVQGRSAVLQGQARRAGGALTYRGFAEFEASLELLLARPAVRAALGSSGHSYTEANYRWDIVLDRYGDLLRRVAGR